MVSGIRSQQMREQNSANRPRAMAGRPQSGRWINHFRFMAGVAFLAVLGFGPAAARPQDEVLSGAFKCAAIADLRTWLDCYYGAAQPQRAALGMAPVPAAQARLVASPPSGTPSAQDVELRDDILKSALECNRTAQGRAWLNCFYAASEPARVRLGLASPMPASPAKTAASSPAIIPPSDFGLTPKPAKTSKSISARMAAYEFDREHLFTATLDNGEVWQQIKGDDQIADWNKPASVYAVVISRGAFGSYNFRVLKSGGLYKVRRVR
jgi:hypothetical protein